MVVRMRHTRAHTGNRRSHHALKTKALALCSDCGEPKLPHRLCARCGAYKGKKVASVTKKIDKKLKKLSQKNKASK